MSAARVAEEEFYIVTGTAFAVHDLAWIKKNLPPGDFEVEALGERIRARYEPKPLYDPGNAKVKG